MKKFMTLALISAATIPANAQALQDAIKLTDKEQFEKATSAFRKILATEPQNGEAWFYLGENYWENERRDSAEICYKKGIEVNPHFPLNHAGMGKVLWSKGRKPEAQAEFDKAVAGAMDKASKFPKPLQGKTYREVAEAVAQGTSKDLSKAQVLIAKAIEMDPKDPETFVLKGDVLFDLDPRDGSSPLENYKTAINLDALNAKPVARKAFMYYRAKNYSASVEEYTKAITIDASFAPAYRGRAEADFLAHNYDAATADMNKYLELNKGDRSARVRYAKFLYLVKKYDEALKEIAALQASGATDATLKRVEGYCLTEKGQFEAAKEAMNDYFVEQGAENIIPLDFEYMGKIYAGLATKVDATAGGIPANYDSLACEMCLKAVRLDRSKDYLYVEAMKSYTKAKMYTYAIATVREKWKNTNKVDVNDLYYLGNAANKSKQWTLADSAWTAYIIKQPNIYQGYLYRARAQNGMDSTKTKTWQAKPFYEEVIRKMKPEETTKAVADLEEALNYMGVYYLYTKDFPKAKCFFQKVSTLNAGTSITKQVNDVMLKTKELKDIAAGNCDVQ